MSGAGNDNNLSEDAASVEASDFQVKEDTQQVVLNTHDIKRRAAADLNFFAALISPTVSKVRFPVYYDWLWQLLTSHHTSTEKVLRFALGLPRSHAKTTFIKLLVVYLILYKKVSFILICCASEKLARNLLEDVDTMLSTEVVSKVWGNWKLGLSRDTLELKRGIFCDRDIILAALGAGSSLRGINIANRRPDFIIMDDIQTRENALSQAENSTLYGWMLATLLKARDFQKCLIVYIGNMYTTDCILYKLKLHRKWQSFITGAILNDWTPLWPEYFTLEDLIDEYEHDAEAGEAEIWFAEVMNIPIGGSQDLIPGGKIPVSPILSYDEPQASFITIDPAGYRTVASHGNKSDDNVVVVHQIFYPMHYMVRDIEHGVMNPQQLIDIVIRKALQYNVKFIGVEAVAYQQTLKFWLDKSIEELGLDLIVVELQPQGRHKTTRITMLIRELLNGDYSLHAEARNKFLWQALAFKPERKDNRDDILDDCAYGMDMRSQHHDQIMYFGGIAQGNIAQGTTAHVMTNNSCLD